MTFRKSLALSVTLLIAASSLAAYQAKPMNVTGVWTGTFTRSGGEPGTAHIDFKQKGTELTGTAGPRADQQSPITGKVTTVKGVTSVVFEATQQNGPTLKFDLKLVDGHLKGKATAENNGQKLEADVDVARAK